MVLRAEPTIQVEESLAVLRDDRYRLETYGVTTWKLREDIERYRDVILRTRPAVVVETGTRYGGSALWFASLGVDVVTVDIKDATPPGYDLLDRGPLAGRLTRVHGSSIDPAVVERVGALVAGRRVMVTLDSDHHAPHVEAEIRRYASLVSIGCYMVVEDGIFDLAASPRDARFGGDQIPELGGPFAAIEATLYGWADWERDTVVEGMSPFTHHPAGWWVKR